MKPKTYTACCPSCRNRDNCLHTIDAETFALFGYDVKCDKCAKWEHIDFMHNGGAARGFTCHKGCPCGYGDK